MKEEGKIEEAAGLITSSKFAVVLSGAGMSTESGITDFRGPDGLWKKIDPKFASIDYLEEMLTNPDSLEKYMGMLAPMIQKLINAKPNAAHVAIAELERMGRIKAVITQNIDALHQRAGSRNVIEVHGTYKTATCMGCGKKYTFEELIRRVAAGKFLWCDCRSFIKPDVVFFGEALPGEALSAAFDLSQRCDLMLVVGSSLVVYPIASVVDIARVRGAKIVMVNMEPTEKDYLADVVINAKLGEVIPAIAAKIRSLNHA